VHEKRPKCVYVEGRMKIFTARNHKEKSAASEWILNYPNALIISCDEPKRSLVRNAQLQS
jgi:hypothetical protein